jgi:23S rRNA (guanosine2251-2'-O)-methyltransferase
MRVYGFHPVREALRHRPHEIDAVLVAGGRGGRRRDEIAELSARHGVPMRHVAAHELAGAPESVHNGFAADLRAARAAAGALTGDPDFLVLVEDVQDPRNLGALMRVCEGAGVGRLLVRDRGSAPLTPAVAKTSAGASEWLPVERISSAANELERLKRDGYWIYGAAAGGEAPWEIDLTGKVVVCLGGEEKGLRQHTREVCDKLIGLPMRGQVQSLNLSTAAAAILYEALRQRTSAKTVRGRASGPEPSPPDTVREP